MSATLIAVTASVVSTIVSVLSASLMVRWHCKNEDIRVGREREQAASDRRRIEVLEQRQR